MELRLGFAAVVLLGAMASTAWAGEKSKPVSPSTLEAMGLGRMQTLSDGHGGTVRGKGSFAMVFGFARIGPIVNPYADAGPNSASGFKALVFPIGGGFRFSGGGASASAN